MSCWLEMVVVVIERLIVVIVIVVILVLIPENPDDREPDHEKREGARPKPVEEIPVHFCFLNIFCQIVFFGGWNPNGCSRSIEASRCATKYKTMKPMMVRIGVMVSLL